MTLTLIVGRDPRGLGTAVILRALARAPGKVLVLDGGNSVNPYALAQAGSPQVLPRVLISRAFTAFQLDELVKRGLGPALAEHGTRRAVVLRPLAAFEELPERDRPRVFESLVRGLVAASRRAAIECVDGVEALSTSLARVAHLEENPWDAPSGRSPTSSTPRWSGGRSFGARCGPRTSGPSTRC